MPGMSMQNELLNLSNQELTDLVKRLGHPGFRARQVADAIFRQRRESLSDVSNSNAESRHRKPRSAAKTSVGASRSRATICVSSQVGCAVNCQFCLTALLGVKRNLTAGEIVGQILAVLRDHSVNLERERMNIVFMGMGEPLLNYENFMKAVRLLVEEVGFPESRITVSTSGIVPRLLDFGKETIR